MRTNSLFICCLVVFGSLCASANALEFKHVGNGGNCTGCEWISASGMVEPGDAERLQIALNSEGYEVKPFRQHNIIMFDSPGGSLSAGINLGKKIRELGFSTGVAKTTHVPDFAASELGTGECISACAYAFLGGKYRYLDGATGFNNETGNSCLGFHQFFDKSAVKRASASATLTTQQTSQIISGIVVEYLNEIEAPLEIYTFASKFTGQEYGCLNKDPVLKAKVDNSSFEFSSAQLLPFGKGLVAQVLSQDDGRTMRLYCMSNGKSLLAYFLPGDVAGTYNDILAGDGNLSGLKFSAKEYQTVPKLELVQYLTNISKTAIVFVVERALAAKAFETGEISTGYSDSGRAQQSWFDAFDFSIKGSAKIPNLIARNCID